MTRDRLLSLLNRDAVWRGSYWSLAACALLLPAIAMQFTGEVNWGVEDFAFAATMLGATGLLLELVLRNHERPAYRIGAAIALAACFFIIWANMAVGIIGSEDNPANLLFGGVVVIATTGTLVSGLRPRAMARAMGITAVSQVLLFLIVLVYGIGFIPFVTLFLTGMWLSSAHFFGLAARVGELGRS